MVMTLNSHGLVSETGQALADSIYEPLLEAHVTELEKVIVATNTKIEQVHQRGRQRLLTQRGVGETITALTKAAAKEVIRLTTLRRRKLDQDIAKADETLSTIERPEQRPTLARPSRGGDKEFRDRRFRFYDQILTSLGKINDRPTREAAIQQAVISDPLPEARDLILALETAPAITRRALASDKFLAGIREEFLRRSNPGAVNNRSAVLAALSIVQHNKVAAIKSVGGSAGLAVAIEREDMVVTR